MATRQSTERRVINAERRYAERERSTARRAGRAVKAQHGDARYTARGRAW